MSRRVLIVVAAALVAGSVRLAAQVAPQVPEAQQVRKLPRQRLSGPRFGFTAFTGDVAEKRSRAELAPVMSQFGWQCENQVVSLTSGDRALLEGLLLFGGLEQGEFNMSVAFLAGFRSESGLEFGAGPNFNCNIDDDDDGLSNLICAWTTSLQVAAGATIASGDMYFPVNVSIGLAKGGPRITALMGWIVR
jgi:hypothetical protein